MHCQKVFGAVREVIVFVRTQYFGYMLDYLIIYTGGPSAVFHIYPIV